MTTMAAIDRVVHHSVILDLMGMESYRAREAIEKREERGRPRNSAGSGGSQLEGDRTSLLESGAGAD